MIDVDNASYREIAEALGIAIPTAPTLKRYGLTEDEWLDILANQGWECPIMKQIPAPSASTGKSHFVVDHEHVRGWKRMAPEQRKKHVRGIISRFANGKLIQRGMTLERARRVVEYLEEYEWRRDA